MVICTGQNTAHRAVSPLKLTDLIDQSACGKIANVTKLLNILFIGNKHSSTV